MPDIKIFLSCEIVLDIFYFLLDILCWKFCKDKLYSSLVPVSFKYHFRYIFINLQTFFIELENFQLRLFGFNRLPFVERK